MGTVHCTLRQLAAGIEIPLDERTTIVVGPDATMATLQGRAFESGKCFPLPRAVYALQAVFEFAVRAAAATALVVGHVNEDDEEPEALSQERGEVLAAWLKGDPDPWLENYDASRPDQKRWGAREDRLLLALVSGIEQVPPTPSVASPNQPAKQKRDENVARYQAARGLKADGIAGPITRKRLIQDYFQLTRGARLAAEPQAAAEDATHPFQLEIEISAHAAAAHFPFSLIAPTRKAALEASNSADSDPTKEPETADERESSDNDGSGSGADEPPSRPRRTPDARIDFVFFFTDAGVDPAPAAADGPEYLEWVKLATRHQEFIAGDGQNSGTQLALELFDKTRASGMPIASTRSRDPRSSAARRTRSACSVTTTCLRATTT